MTVVLSFTFNKIFTTFFIKIIIQRIIYIMYFQFSNYFISRQFRPKYQILSHIFICSIRIFHISFPTHDNNQYGTDCQYTKKYIKYWNPVHHVPSLCFTNFSPSLSNSSSTFPVFFWHHQFPFSDYILPFH